MDTGLIVRIIFGLVTLLWPLVILWNRYLHSSLMKNCEAVEDLRLEMAKDYVSNTQLDKYFSQMEKRFDRLEAKIDLKE
ncbi:hypothetical protein [Maridesulfovibrio bastinii]|uniref:hypothetical protein n=1 Tax=Maridesulfovibrio bastinii TaxID=47157 RepID=UPI000484D8D9|nr:hypothetical protein [Maridesulfovibrio bastinii]